MVLAIVLVASLIAADLRFNSLGTTRSMLDSAAAPIYWIADLPTRLRDWSDAHVRSRSQLLEDNERLQHDEFLGKGTIAVTEFVSGSPSLCAVADS